MGRAVTGLSSLKTKLRGRYLGKRRTCTLIQNSSCAALCSALPSGLAPQPPVRMGCRPRRRCRRCCPPRCPWSWSQMWSLSRLCRRCCCCCCFSLLVVATPSWSWSCRFRLRPTPACLAAPWSSFPVGVHGVVVVAFVPCLVGLLVMRRRRVDLVSPSRPWTTLRRLRPADAFVHIIEATSPRRRHVNLRTASVMEAARHIFATKPSATHVLHLACGGVHILCAYRELQRAR